MGHVVLRGKRRGCGNSWDMKRGDLDLGRCGGGSDFRGCGNGRDVKDGMSRRWNNWTRSEPKVS
jgi:hypothetical protein